MGIFETATSWASSKMKEREQRRQEEAAFEKKIRDEARIMEKIEFEKEFKKRALEAAKIKAHQDAMKKTGLAKLRAIQQAQDLDKPKPNAFARLSEYTRANKMRREENLKKTQVMKQAVKEMRTNNNQRTAFQPVRPLRSYY